MEPKKQQSPSPKGSVFYKFCRGAPLGVPRSKIKKKLIKIAKKPHTDDDVERVHRVV